MSGGRNLPRQLAWLLRLSTIFILASRLMIGLWTVWRAWSGGPWLSKRNIKDMEHGTRAFLHIRVVILASSGFDFLKGKRWI